VLARFGRLYRVLLVKTAGRANAHSVNVTEQIRNAAVKLDAVFMREISARFGIGVICAGKARLFYVVYGVSVQICYKAAAYYAKINIIHNLIT
jgi:hypothetical protein